MTVILDGDGVAVVGKGLQLARFVADVLCGKTVHVGIEVALARLVLIGQIDAELVEGESDTGSDAIGRLPVGVVGGGSHVCAW